MKKLASINLENIDIEATSDYRVRYAARAVVFDENNLVALLPVSKHNYYKLPGGGVEDGEDIIEAVKRECLEETGCAVEILQELGEVIEYRPKFTFKQTSYCYIAKVVGKKGLPELTESEASEGFLAPVWVTLEEAIELVIRNIPTDYQGPFIVKRDATFLAEVKKLRE